MKKLILSVLAIAAMTSCTKSSDEEIDPNAPVEIKLNAGIEALARAEVSQTTGITGNGVQFVRINGESPNWTTISAITTTGSIAATTGVITFSTLQYYPTDGSNANIVGFYPKAENITAGVASMKITGEEDVIYASSVSGNKETPIASAMPFNHKLTQFKFVIQRDAASTDTDITNVSVKIKDSKTTFKLALADGELSDWTTPLSTIQPITNATAKTAASTPTDGFMLQPDMSSISLSVSATGYTAQDITINGTDNNKFETGKAYTITLTFKGTEITPSSTIAEWGDGTGADGEIE